MHPPYDGSFPVVKRIEKYFKVLRNGEETVVPIDHLNLSVIVAGDTGDIPNSLLIADKQTSTHSSKTTDVLSSSDSQDLQNPRHPDVAVNFDPLSDLTNAVC